METIDKKQIEERLEKTIRHILMNTLSTDEFMSEFAFFKDCFEQGLVDSPWYYAQVFLEARTLAFDEQKAQGVVFIKQYLKEKILKPEARRMLGIPEPEIKRVLEDMCSQLDYGHIDYETFLKWYNFLALIKTADYNVDDYYNSYYSYLRKLFECIVVCKTDEELRSLPIYNRALIQAMKAELREFEKRMSEGKRY